MDLHQPSPEAAPDPASAAAPHKLGVPEMRARIIDKLKYQVGKSPERANPRDWFMATAFAVRDSVLECWFQSRQRSVDGSAKRVYYLSLEFLIGRLLADTIGNLGLTPVVREALALEGVDFDELREREPDAALGNGGLGRLAACFMESMATLEINSFGYGIRYDHGLFKQKIIDGVQEELPEDWLSFGNPWEFERAEFSYRIGFGGTVAATPDGTGNTRYTWHPGEQILALAYDTPVIGGGGRHANALRLWSARALTPLHLDAFNRGDHEGAQRDRVRTEAVSRVLYPGDESDAGQELRLRQEFFFASASLQDLIYRHTKQFGDIRTLSDKAAIQLNDTHPAIVVIELMRLLMDEHNLGWDEAWTITVATVSYTNHTLLPEALETWPVHLMERLLPRHMQIIYLLNARHLTHVGSLPDADDRLLASTSLIEEGHGRRVRMGHLAFLGSHAINGVSALHTHLIKQSIFQDLDHVYGGRIQNKTNGITFRRWLHRANPGLTSLLVEALGERVLTDADALEGLKAYADDAAFKEKFAKQRRVRKDVLAKVIAERVGIMVDPAALFDVHVKRIHEYKRQLLNILHCVALYDSMRAQPNRDWVKRVKIFAGKAAPGYFVAKQIIRLAHDVAHLVNNDPSVDGKLQVVFLPNYNVSLAEQIIPAADLSEQISTAGMEASGTGNMKLALNGALTIGTLDGANVEIRDAVGPDNIFIFGLTTEEVAARKRNGLSAHGDVAASPDLAQAIESIRRGAFSPSEPGRYADLIHNLLDRDTFMVGADFDSYVAAQQSVDHLWRDPAQWWRAAVMNTASVGWFSSDRTIAQYAAEIWGIPIPRK